ncbi:MAG: ABC transporter ATP-binding protein, partial [Thermodesulfobacteriota bacterium]
VLARCLSDVIPLFQAGSLDGSVFLAGQKTTSGQLADGSGVVSLITDDPQNQLFCPTLAEDLAFGPCNLKLPVVEVRERIEQALEWVGLAGFEHRRPETLSGGEAQRAALASFLTLGAPLLILDRAADQMDSETRKKLYFTLASQCRDQGKSVIVIDEQFKGLLPLASRVIFLEQGEVAFDGPPDRIPGALLDGICRPSRGPLIHRVKPKLESGAAPFIEVRDLSYAYPGCTFAMRDVSLKIRQGEFVAILGRNGAGKTTLIRHFNGLSMADSGNVWVDGFNTRDHPPAFFADRIGYLFQDPESQLFADTVRNEVGFALRVKGVPKAEIDNRVEVVLNTLGLLPVADTHPYKLDRGAMQILALAACLVNSPRILVLDEPVSHMSYPRNWKILELIDRLNRQDLTIILVTHDFEIAQYFSTRMVFMEEGRITKDIPNPYADSAKQAYTDRSKEMAA